jgi:RNA polymerase sigma-70 factor (ECF subfamily)
MPDDYILITKAQTGDREALNQLVSCYWQPIYRLVAYKTGNLDEAQEITQETFLRAFRSLPRYQSTGASFKTYLTRIAIHLIYDAWRKKGRSPQITDLNEYPELSAAEDHQPEIQAAHQERREILTSVLNKLPDDQRQAVELRIIAELSVKQTAAAMKKSEAAVKMLQQRALQNLRKLLLQSGITL